MKMRPCRVSRRAGRRRTRAFLWISVSRASLELDRKQSKDSGWPHTVLLQEYWISFPFHGYSSFYSTESFVLKEREKEGKNANSWQ